MGSRHITADAMATNPWALTGFALATLALWMLFHPFRGIAHDGQIYTFFALSQLYPGSVGHDFFARFGAQDHYTVFTPLYARLIRLLGIDRAAAAVTFGTQIAFYATAWKLIRIFAPFNRAMLAVGLLVVLPSWYGANMVFSHTELFATPRQPAEACVLLTIAFVLRNRRVAAAVSLGVAVLLHPIIAGAGLVFWVALEFAVPYPGPAFGICAGGLMLMWVLAQIPGVLPHFDPVWLSVLTERLSYLFPTRWSAVDWGHSVPPVTTLIVGGLTGHLQALRRLSGATVITAAAGLALAIVGGDLLHITLASQLQGWRLLWLAGVMSALLLVVIAENCWHQGDLGRAALLLLVASWLTSNLPITYLSAGFACLCALCADKPTAIRHQRLVLCAATAMLVISASEYLWESANLVRDAWELKPSDPSTPVAISRVEFLSRDNALWAAPLMLVWLAGMYATRRAAILLAALGAAAVLALIPFAWSTWTHLRYTAADAEAFQPWRQIIPENAEVLSPDSNPDDLWYLLHRASYWSLLQMAGMVFSRQDTMTGTRRETAVATLVDALGGEADRHPPGRDLDPVRLRESLCAVPDLRYFISGRDLGPTPYPTVTLRRDNQIHTLHLYQCAPRPVSR